MNECSLPGGLRHPGVRIATIVPIKKSGCQDSPSDMVNRLSATAGQKKEPKNKGVRLNIQTRSNKTPDACSILTPCSILVMVDVAARERSRLHLGDGPVLELRQVLEINVGIRVFCVPRHP
ncbi:MAG: hypothetical protein R3C05_10385 [Pirellulaceae bacterium]